MRNYQVREKFKCNGKNLIDGFEKDNKLIKKARYKIRKDFYFYLGIALVILVSIYVGSSKNESIESKNREQIETENQGKDTTKIGEEKSTFSRVITLIGCDNLFEKPGLFESLPVNQKEKILLKYRDIKENYSEVRLYAALISGLLTFLDVFFAYNYALDRSMASKFGNMECYREHYIRRMEYEDLRRQEFERRTICIHWVVPY